MTDVICLSLRTMQPVEFPKAAVLCLGNFDGVHLAHRALMNTAIELRAHRWKDAVCGAFCFDPPSSDYFCKGSPAHLSTLEEKLSRFYDCGMEYAYLARFEALREMTPERFATEILRDRCNCVAAVCGFNYRFGYKGAGTPEALRDILQIPVKVQSEVMADGETVSSTRIRTLLREGRVEEATGLLTVPYTLKAEVLHGKELGRTWGFPTVNQQFPHAALIPRHGVYVTECVLPNGQRVRGVSNVGRHPTVDSDATVNCETHLIGFDGSLYGEQITVSFLHFLRSEIKFENADALRLQIAQDLQAAASYQA